MYKNDIPYQIAERAFHGTSFSPEKRAERVIEDYSQMLAEDGERIREIAGDKWEDEFNRYRENLKNRYIAWLSARSNCISSMITGPARFPTRRAEKANDRESRLYSEMMEFRKKALMAINKKYHPFSNTVISSDDPEAIDKLKRKLKIMESAHDTMKEAIAIIRSKVSDDQKIEKLGEIGIDEESASSLLIPDYMGRAGFAAYAFQNSNANIKRVKARIAQLEKRQSQETTAKVYDNGIEIINNIEANRIQVFFPGKPDESIRTELKHYGFRWSPKNGCWQAYINARSKQAATAIAGGIK